MARLGRALLAYTALVFALRAWHRGAWALYGLLWGCNQALLLAAYGLLADRPVLVGGALAVVATDQLLWYVDAAGRALLGRWPVGVASYLEARATPLERATSLHHLWFMPLLAWALAHGKEAVAAADGGDIALDGWENVQEHLYALEINPPALEILYMSSHTHALSLGTMALVLVLLLAATRYARRGAGLAIALMGAALLADMGGWFLAREREFFAYVVVGSGCAFALGVVLSCLLVFLELWLPDNRGDER